MTGIEIHIESENWVSTCDLADIKTIRYDSENYCFSVTMRNTFQYDNSKLFTNYAGFEKVYENIELICRIRTERSNKTGIEEEDIIETETIMDYKLKEIPTEKINAFKGWLECPKTVESI